MSFVLLRKEGGEIGDEIFWGVRCAWSERCVLRFRVYCSKVMALGRKEDGMRRIFDVT
jgi:hypothetical protein